MTPICIEAASVDASDGWQRLHFDADGLLLRHVQGLRGDVLSDDTWAWGPDALRITGGIHAGTWTLGPHGEVLGNAALGVEVTWEGTFAPAAPRWWIEEIYIGNAHILLPRHTADRWFMERMRPFAFTGTATVRGHFDAVARYEDGRLVELRDGEVTVVTWSPDGRLLREVSPSLTVDYTWAGSELVRTVMTAQGHSRTVDFERRDGRLTRVRTDFATGGEHHKSVVELRPCR